MTYCKLDKKKSFKDCKWCFKCTYLTIFHTSSMCQFKKTLFSHYCFNFSSIKMQLTRGLIVDLIKCKSECICINPTVTANLYTTLVLCVMIFISKKRQLYKVLER